MPFSNLWLYFVDLRLRRSCSQPTTLQVLSLPDHLAEAPKTSFLSIKCAHSEHKGDQYRRPGEADVRSNFQKLKEAGPQMELHSIEKDNVKNDSHPRISRLLTYTFTHVTPFSLFLVHSVHQKSFFYWRKEQMKQCRCSYRSTDHPPRSRCWRSHPKDTQQWAVRVPSLDFMEQSCCNSPELSSNKLCMWESKFLSCLSYSYLGFLFLMSKPKFNSSGSWQERAQGKWEYMKQAQ